MFYLKWITVCTFSLLTTVLFKVTPVGHLYVTLMVLQSWLVLFPGVSNVQARDIQEFTATSIIFKNGSNQWLCAVMSNVQMGVIASSIGLNQRDIVFVQDHGVERNVKRPIPVCAGINMKKKLHLVWLRFKIRSRDLRIIPISFRFHFYSSLNKRLSGWTVG